MRLRPTEGDESDAEDIKTWATHSKSGDCGLIFERAYPDEPSPRNQALTPRFRSRRLRHSLAENVK
jgi:ubiquitin